MSAVCGQGGSMGYRVKLDVFEGPFDLLVYLIEHARMSIYDIKISEITDQYLEYVGSMQSADVGVYSEFMVLASALLEIKSKMLLPRNAPEDAAAEIPEDPRLELVSKLVEYKRFKVISEILEERWQESAMYLEKPQEDLTDYTGEPDEYLSLDIKQFMSAFEKFLNRKKKLEEIREHHRRSEKQRITTEARMGDIKRFFVDSGLRETDFRTLVPGENDRYETAVTFSSVLEMMKQRRLDAEQQYLFGDITVSATDALFEESEPDKGETNAGYDESRGTQAAPAAGGHDESETAGGQDDTSDIAAGGQTGPRRSGDSKTEKGDSDGRQENNKISN